MPTSTSQQGLLEAAPADLGDTCSSENLQTVAGIAACRTACRSARCCQTNIGSAGCGYEICGSYGECNALVSIVDIGVPQGGYGGSDGDGAGDAGDGVDVGAGEDVGDIDDRGEGVDAKVNTVFESTVSSESSEPSESVEIGQNTDEIINKVVEGDKVGSPTPSPVPSNPPTPLLPDVGDGGDSELDEDSKMTTTKPAGDVAFNDPDDGSLLDAAESAGSIIENTKLDDFDDILKTFPVESIGDQDHGSGEEEEVVVEKDTVLVDGADAAADDTAGKKKQVEVDAVLKAKEKGKTKGITAAAFAATEAKATTDPSSLSTGQFVGIAVGVFVAFCMLICLIKCCCCRKKSE